MTVATAALADDGSDSDPDTRPVVCGIKGPMIKGISGLYQLDTLWLGGDYLSIPGRIVFVLCAHMKVLRSGCRVYHTVSDEPRTRECAVQVHLQPQPPAERKWIQTGKWRVKTSSCDLGDFILEKRWDFTPLKAHRSRTATPGYITTI